MNRLQQLLDLRRQVEQEIERERAFQRRVNMLHKTAALAITTRSGWSNQILATVAQHFTVTVEEITGPGRAAEVVRARFVACWLMRESGRSLPDIGRALNRDHTTALNALRRCEADAALLATAVALRGQMLGTGVAA